MGRLLNDWEAEQREQERRSASRRLRSTLRITVIAGIGFVAGAHFAAAPLVRADEASDQALAARATRAEAKATAKHGELELFRQEMRRLRHIVEQSARHRIPADLATAIYDHAVAEGIDPTVAYRLVQTESGFSHFAISPKGAVGLTQLMPSTAYGMDSTLRYKDLFERDTNLKLGFRYLRQMLRKYDGDLKLALLAYNRGPGTVDSIRQDGGDPSNGYARKVMGKRTGATTQPAPGQPK